MTVGAHSRPGRSSPVPGLFRLWWLPALLFFLLMALWSLATPIGAAPDEASQALRAVSLDRGQLLGPSVPGGGPAAYTKVTVPDTYVQLLSSSDCYQLKPLQPASCIPAIRPSSKPTTEYDYTGRYPPLYYAVVGLPSLLTDRLIGFRLMRLVSAALDAGLLGLAVATARRWSTSVLLPAAITVATTPMCLFLGGVLNPSSLEISAAVAMWTAAVVLVTDHLSDPPRALVWVVAASAAILALARADSPLWLVVAAVILAPLYLRRGGARLLRRRHVQMAIGLVAVAAAAALSWTFAAHALDVVPTPIKGKVSETGAIAASLGVLRLRYLQEIGFFGTLDTPAPWFTVTCWYLLSGAALAVGVVAARRRQLITILLTVVIASLVPVLLEVTDYRKNGLIGQGRYSLPAGVAVPIVLLGCVGGARAFRRYALRVGFWVGTTVAVAQAVAFYFTLRRYRVGTSGPIFGSKGVPADVVWSPPLGTIPIEVLFAVACAALTWSVVRWTVTTPEAPVEGDLLVPLAMVVPA